MNERPCALTNFLADQWRLLTFRQMKVPRQAYRHYLCYSLLITWMCGVGRYWDNPRAEWWQFIGLGSMIYVMVLASILWLLIAPLRPQKWRFSTVLLFVTMTSAPALLYAIPVERFMSFADAEAANAWFLAIVAVWRVALLIKFLHAAADLKPYKIMLASLLPLALIITVLTMLNLEHVVFRLMAGIGPEERSTNDGAYIILWLLSVFSMLALPFLVGLYLCEVIRTWWSQRKSRQNCCREAAEEP